MELKGLYNKGWISNFIESGLKGWGQIMYYMGCCREAFLWMGSGFTLCKVFFGVASHEWHKYTQFSLQFSYKTKNTIVSYFLLRKVHVKFHRSTFVQGVESPERKTKKRPWDETIQNKEHTRIERSKYKVYYPSISWIFILLGCKTRPRGKCGLSVAQLTKPADTGNCRLLPYHFVRSGFQGRGA